MNNVKVWAARQVSAKRGGQRGGLAGQCHKQQAGQGAGNSSNGCAESSPRRGRLSHRISTSHP
jgi:hypothetical protein